MRRVILGETGIETSALGFGCASLGSRVGARGRAGGRSRRRIDAGVTWFDLAPVYGGGEAEAIAAPFLQAEPRPRCRSPPRPGSRSPRRRGRAAAAADAARPRRAGAGRARRLAGRRRGCRAAAPKANAKPPLTPALITGSLEASLRRLGTDHVDLFALHAPDPAEVGRDDILARARGASSPPARPGRWRSPATPRRPRRRSRSARPTARCSSRCRSPGEAAAAAVLAAARGGRASASVVHSVLRRAAGAAARRGARRTAAGPGLRAQSRRASCWSRCSRRRAGRRRWRRPRGAGLPPTRLRTAGPREPFTLLGG